MTKTTATATPSQDSKVQTLATHAWEFAQRQWAAAVLAALVVLALVLAAYSAWPRLTATPAATATTPAYARVCVAGVSYLQFKSGATVEWTPAGKVKTCAEPATK